jgi:glycosyltransferase involved in cell wall biosynthesis
MQNKKLLHIFSAPQSVYYFMAGQLQFMIKNGFEVHLVLPRDNYFAPLIKARDPNVTYHYVPIQRKASLLADLKSFFKIKKIIKQVNPDIIHLHTPKASFLGALASKLLGYKNVIYQMHGLVSTDGFKVKRGLIYFLEKSTCSLVTKVFAVSDSLKSYAIENGYCQANKINVIGNGTINGIDYEDIFNPDKIDIQNHEFDRKKFPEKFIVGFIGRICADKGIYDFLDVISELRNKIPIIGVVVGPQEMGGDLDKYIKQNKLEDHVLIFKETRSPEKFLIQFDLLLFPTKREGFGLIAAEANALKVPVVAYEIPGVKDAVENNRTGKLVEYRNGKALANAVKEYYSSPNERTAQGLNGRNRVARLFNRKRLWKDILANYERLLNS